MCGAAAAAEANKLKQATNFTYNTDSALSKHHSRTGFICFKKSAGTNTTSHRTIPTDRCPEKKKKKKKRKKEITQTVKPVTQDTTFNEHLRL